MGSPPKPSLSSPPIFLDRHKRTLGRNHVPELGQRRAIAQGIPALGYAFCTAAHHALSHHTARTDTRHAYRQTGNGPGNDNRNRLVLGAIDLFFIKARSRSRARARAAVIPLVRASAPTVRRQAPPGQPAPCRAWCRYIPPPRANSRLRGLLARPCTSALLRQPTATKRTHVLQPSPAISSIGHRHWA